MQGLLLGAATVEAACKTLVSLALERGGEDNVTVIVAELSGDGCPAIVDPERVSLETVEEFVAKP